jgi:predicted GIY-YIG superfamily endonuclease
MTGYFVYSLSCNECVFYIGKTKNLLSRYNAHLNSYKKSGCLTPVATHIKYLLENSNTIEIRVIACLPKDQAAKKEKEIIAVLSRGGHKLFNDHHSDYRWIAKPWPQSITREEITTKIKHIQETALDVYTWNNRIFK